MKTIKEWFSLLPSYIEQQATNNTVPEMLEMPADSLSFALSTAFNWKDTPEGYTYWAELETAISDDEEAWL